jgi:hypothetical protein
MVVAVVLTYFCAKPSAVKGIVCLTVVNELDIFFSYLI